MTPDQIRDRILAGTATLDQIAEGAHCDDDVYAASQEIRRLRTAMLQIAARLVRGEGAVSDDPAEHGYRRIPARVAKAIRDSEDQLKRLGSELADAREDG